MPRWNTQRWSLGAPALIALAVAGCGTTATQQRLGSGPEKRLLSLIARARADASRQDVGGVHVALGEFVSNVETLQASGRLSRATAGGLEREARAAAARSRRQLRPLGTQTVGGGNTGLAADPAASDQAAPKPGDPAASDQAAAKPGDGQPAGDGHPDHPDEHRQQGLKPGPDQQGLKPGPDQKHGQDGRQGGGND